jgi:hypothetical protein
MRRDTVNRESHISALSFGGLSARIHSTDAIVMRRLGSQASPGGGVLKACTEACSASCGCVVRSAEFTGTKLCHLPCCLPAEGTSRSDFPIICACFEA